LHVLSVIHYPVYGGPHNRNAAVIPVLEARGIHTTVLLPLEPGNARSLLSQRNVSTVCLPLSRMRAVRDPRVHLDFARRFRTEVGRLRGLIRAFEVDLVLVNGLVNPHAAVAGHLEGIPVVWQLLDTFAPMPLRAAMMALVTRLADVIMSTGRAVARAHPAATTFGERLVLFFPVADTTLFINGREARRSARQRLGLGDGDVVVGNVGNLNPMKGHDVFIRAAAHLRDRRPATRFVILGSGAEHQSSYVEQLWRTASQLGLRLGHDLIVVDPGIEVALIAPAFDVFWLTSKPRSEGIPTVIGEAMSLELPVIATRVGSVHEVVEDGVTGTLVSPCAPEALAEATLPYLDSAHVRRAAGLAGRARAERLCSPESCADRHEHAFALATTHRRGRRRGPVVRPAVSPPGPRASR
jgi:glycosyltransferase involved in cell wall biosynthesis